MSEVVPAASPVAAPASVVKAAAVKSAVTKKPKKTVSSKARKAAGPSVTELITKAVSTSQERKGLSLAAVKKALAAGGYDVEKNNSRIKIGLKSLVGRGTLVQTKGIGASGSFRLSKKPEEVKKKALQKQVVAAKPRKSAAKRTASTPKKPKKAVAAKSPKKAKKPVAAAAKKVAKRPKVIKAAKSKKVGAKSPAKVKVVKAKAAKPKAAKVKKAAAKKK